MVGIDVVVTDPKGRAVTGLTQGDFSIEEDKKSQTVLSFEVHADDDEPTYKMTEVPTLARNTFLNLPRGQTGTATVILIDALNTSFADQAYGREEIAKFLAHRRPDSRIAIFVLATKLYLVRGFDDELGTVPELQQAVQKYVDQDRWNRGGPDHTLTGRVKLTLSALDRIGRFLAYLPGRKDLIWYSSAFPENILPGMGPEVVNYSQEVREATDLLNLSHVSVYPVDVRGVRGDPFLSSSIPGRYGRAYFGSSQGGQTDPIQVRHQIFINLDTAVRATMDSVADDTGGHAFYGTNDLEEALGEAMTAGSTYYSLSYSPTNPKYDGSLRHIKVTLKKSGYTLAYRRTYFADDLDAVAKSVADAPPSPLLPALERGTPLAHGLLVEAHLEAVGAPVPATPEQMQVLAQYETLRSNRKAPLSQTTPGAAPVMMQQYLVSYGLVARQLEMPAGDTGARQASLEFGVIAYDEDGRKLNGLDTRVDDPIPPERYAKLVSDAYRASQPVFVPLTATLIRLAVRDLHGNRTGSLEVKLPLVRTTDTQ